MADFDVVGDLCDCLLLRADGRATRRGQAEKLTAFIRAQSPEWVAELIGGDLGWSTRLWSGGHWEHANEQKARDDADFCNATGTGPGEAKVVPARRVVGPWVEIPDA